MILYTRYSLAATMLLAAIILVACAPAAAVPAPSPTVASKVTPVKSLTAQEILDRSRPQMQALKSVHFLLQTANGQIALGQGMSLTEAEGDAVAPDRVDVKTKLTVSGQSLPVEIIGVSGNAYLRDPIFGRWTGLGNVPQLQFFTPTGGLAIIMRDIKNVRRIGDETVDGVPSYHLQGTLDPSGLAALLGAAPASNPVTLDMWIGADDFLVHQIAITGPIQQSDSPTLAMTLKLSNHNESINIQAPQ